MSGVAPRWLHDQKVIKVVNVPLDIIAQATTSAITEKILGADLSRNGKAVSV